MSQSYWSFIQMFLNVKQREAMFWDKNFALNCETGINLYYDCASLILILKTVVLFFKWSKPYLSIMRKKYKIQMLFLPAK